MNCIHPDHIDSVSCEDRAVACAPDCICCLPNCANCSHLLSLHDPKYGCEVERGDGLIGDAEFPRALGPCGCRAMMHSTKTDICALCGKPSQSLAQAESDGPSLCGQCLNEQEVV